MGVIRTPHSGYLPLAAVVVAVVVVVVALEVPPHRLAPRVHKAHPLIAAPVWLQEAEILRAAEAAAGVQNPGRRTWRALAHLHSATGDWRAAKEGAGLKWLRAALAQGDWHNEEAMVAEVASAAELLLSCAPALAPALAAALATALAPVWLSRLPARPCQHPRQGQRQPLFACLSSTSCPCLAVSSLAFQSSVLRACLAPSLSSEDVSSLPFFRSAPRLRDKGEYSEQRHQQLATC